MSRKALGDLHRVVAKARDSGCLSKVTREWATLLANVHDGTFVTGQYEPVGFGPDPKRFRLPTADGGLIVSGSGPAYLDLLSAADFHFDWLATAAFPPSENFLLTQLSYPYADGDPRMFQEPPVPAFLNSIAELYVWDDCEAVVLTKDRTLVERCLQITNLEGVVISSRYASDERDT